MTWRTCAGVSGLERFLGAAVQDGARAQGEADGAVAEEADGLHVGEGAACVWTHDLGASGIVSGGGPLLERLVACLDLLAGQPNGICQVLATPLQA